MLVLVLLLGILDTTLGKRIVPITHYSLLIDQAAFFV
jgi:hypothetical protein